MNEIGRVMRLAIVNGDQVIVVKHETTGWFGIPGGKVEDDEVGNPNVDMVTACLKRECKEETGVDVSRLFEHMSMLGYCLVRLVNETERTVRTLLVFCFCAYIGEADKGLWEKLLERQDVEALSIYNPGKNLYPDANLIIKRLKTPQSDLSLGNPVVLQHKPELKVLDSLPDWVQ